MMANPSSRGAKLASAGLLGLSAVLCAPVCATNERTEASLYRVVLVPADGGTEHGTKADFEPLFKAIGKMTGLRFHITVSQSYAAATEAMCSRVAEIGWFGPVSYVQTRDRGCAELLAVDVVDGRSVYYAGIFAKAESGIEKLADLKGRAMAFGDVNSTSSFTFPVAMLLQAGLRLPEDLGAIRLTGSHANSLAALTQGQVDAAGVSFDSFEKAARQGAIRSIDYRVVARSAPIPNPPLAMHPRLPVATKARLRDAFNKVHLAPGVKPEMVRGYGGKKVDRYDSTLAESDMEPAIAVMAKVDDELKGAMLTEAGAR